MTKLNNYKLILCLILMKTIFLLSSCKSYNKIDYFTEYNQFITQVESEYTQYDENKWEEIDLVYNKFNKELYDKIYADLDQFDQQQIGKLKARFHKVKYMYEVNSTFQSIKDVIQQTTGAIEEVLESTEKIMMSNKDVFFRV